MAGLTGTSKIGFERAGRHGTPNLRIESHLPIHRSICNGKRYIAMRTQVPQQTVNDCPTPSTPATPLHTTKWLNGQGYVTSVFSPDVPFSRPPTGDSNEADVRACGLAKSLTNLWAAQEEPPLKVDQNFGRTTASMQRGRAALPRRRPTSMPTRSLDPRTADRRVDAVMEKLLSSSSEGFWSRAAEVQSRLADHNRRLTASTSKLRDETQRLVPPGVNPDELSPKYQKYHGFHQPHPTGPKVAPSYETETAERFGERSLSECALDRRTDTGRGKFEAITNWGSYLKGNCIYASR